MSVQIERKPKLGLNRRHVLTIDNQERSDVKEVKPKVKYSPARRPSNL